MDLCPPRLQEAFTDGLQAGLVIALRQLAGEGGLAYLLREHEYFPGVFFPVAASWSPRAADGEGHSSLHLSNYACLAYVFHKEQANQQMPAAFLDIVREWRIEALFLSQDRFDCVEEKEGQICVNGDPWTRRIYDLEPGPEDDAHYRLVIGGPLAPTGVLTTPLRKTMKRMILETWPIVTRRNLVAITDKGQLIAQLADYFEDQSPAPPYTNAPVFKIWTDGETRYGLNQLAFNCFLAHQIAEFSKNTVPPIEDLKEIEKYFKRKIAPPVRNFWSDTLARTPHVLKMLDRAPKAGRSAFLREPYVDRGDEILKDIEQRAPLCPDVKTSRVLELLSRFCEDHVLCVEEPISSETGEWIFWIRANHIRPPFDQHEKRAQVGEELGDSNDQPASLRSFKKLWRISVPAACDLLNAVWGVHLVDDRPKLLVPLFMRFNKVGRERFCEQFAEQTVNAMPPPWAIPELSIIEPEVRPRIELGVWPERGMLDEPTLTEKIKRSSKPILEDAARAPALKKSPADVLLDYLRKDNPFAASGGELGHDWRGDPLQIDTTVEHLAKFYRLSIGRNPQFIEPLFVAMRHFWDPLEPKRTLYMSPLSLLLIFRLVELASLEPADCYSFSMWLRYSCPRLLEREGRSLDAPLVCIGKPRSAIPWWMEMVSFVDTIRLHKTTQKPLLGVIALEDTERSFSLRLRLEGFDYARFVACVRGDEEQGRTTTQYLKLLATLGQDPRASLAQPAAFPPGLSVYMVPASDAAADLIVAAEPGIR
ncbi:MAG: hypothetical protein QOF89_329 [Acidobacteriota bacterium]|jgi:hypothetical protein|nr:hypothetical protein [Acidobacteriota bacterium]